MLRGTVWDQALPLNRSPLDVLCVRPAAAGFFVCLNERSIPLQCLKPEGWSVKHENLKVKPTGSQKRKRWMCFHCPSWGKPQKQTNTVNNKMCNRFQIQLFQPQSLETVYLGGSFHFFFFLYIYLSFSCSQVNSMLCIQQEQHDKNYLFFPLASD